MGNLRAAHTSEVGSSLPSLNVAPPGGIRFAREESSHSLQVNAGENNKAKASCINSS